MKNQIDWGAAKAAIFDVATRYFGDLGKARKVRCPWHADNTPSLHIHDNGYHCYGCGEHGDAVDLVVKLDGVDKVEAYRRIVGDSLMPFPVARRQKPKKPNPWKMCPGAEGEPEIFGETPSARFPYYREGALVGYVYRYDPPGKPKYFRQVTSRVNQETGVIEWRWIGFDHPTPLYKAEPINDVLVIVEGEKCVEYLRPRIPACTWIGGANGVKNADWSQIKASKVILWPDNDDTGKKAMAFIATALSARGIAVRIVDLAGLDAKVDAADLSIEECIKRLQAASAYEDEPTEAVPTPETAKMPVKFLGYQDTTHYFLKLDTQVIVEAQPQAMTRNWLVGLLGLPFLEGMFTVKGKWSAEHAIDALCNQSMQAGVYSPDAFRGRGIWADAGRIIYHAGSRAYVDGVETRLSDIKSEYTYPISPSLTKPGEPLTDEQGRAWILKTACAPSWMLPVNGYLLTGWIMVSLLAGVIRWRPSLWIQAPAGSGKSSVVDNFMGLIMGSYKEHIRGDTTEAGLRQMMRFDARPVLCEEAEVQDQHDAMRMKGLLTMMRQASSDGGSKTYRGTAGGKAQAFSARSPWCFVSIQSSATLQADRERLCKITLRSTKTGNISEADGKAASDAFKALCAVIPHDIHARLIGRALAVAGIARETVEVMAEAIRPRLQSQREADQLGTLMAGAWLIEHSTVPTHEEAEAYVEPWEWEEINEAAQESDSDRALDVLYGIRFHSTMGIASVYDRLRAIWMGIDSDGHHKAALAAYGLSWKPKDGCLFVCHNNQNLIAEFNKTPYRGFGDLLAALPGVYKSKQKCGGPQARHGLMIPVTANYSPED